MCAAVLLASGTAHAQPTAGELSLVMQQRIGVAIAPTGAEHWLATGLSLSLDDGDPLRSGAHVAAGLTTSISPVDLLSGAYVSIAPFAFLSVRAEVQAMSSWSIDPSIVGYAPQASESATFSGAGPAALGLRAALGTTLAMAVQLGPVRPILHVQLGAAYERMGDAPFRWSARHARLLARDDWLLSATTHLFLELRLEPHVALRLGAFDDVGAVARAGPLTHVLGPAAMLVLERLDPHVPELSVIVRSGARLDETPQAGSWTAVIAVIAGYDLMRIR